MSIRSVSFFDDENVGKQKSVWTIPTNQNSDLNKISPYLSATFLKRSKIAGKSKKVSIFLDHSFLYCVKGDHAQKINGVLDLTCTKIDFIVNQDPTQIESSCKQQLFGFKFSKNQRGIDIFTTDEQLFKDWKKILGYRGIQTTFHEEFVVTKMIGKGSFAKVYLAQKKENKLQYAIKAFNKEFMLTQHKGKESLINEIKIMRALNNDHLIHLYEVYETTNSIYFVVDLIDGGELLNKIRSKESISEIDVQQLMRNLCYALSYLHEKQIMHRDLKPENLLLKSKQSDFDIVLADFGLATFMNDQNILFRRCGTPGFVAPEVLSYKEGDPMYNEKCDIFSAGVIFYLALTGKQPFQGKDYKKILRANKACEISFDIPELKKVSPEAMDLLKKQLDPNPFTRLTAKQCLEHPFLYTEKSLKYPLTTQENLKNYDVDFVYNIRNKIPDSQEQIGSLALHQVGTPAMNGKTDTMGSLSNYSNQSFGNLVNKAQKQPQQSKFAGVKDNNSKDGQQKMVMKDEYEDLHKKALKNSQQLKLSLNKNEIDDPNDGDTEETTQQLNNKQQPKESTMKHGVSKYEEEQKKNVKKK